MFKTPDALRPRLPVVSARRQILGPLQPAANRRASLRVNPSSVRELSSSAARSIVTPCRSKTKDNSLKRRTRRARLIGVFAQASVE